MGHVCCAHLFCWSTCFVVPFSHPASLRTHRLKDTAVKNSKTVRGKQKTKAGPLHVGSHGATSHVPMKPALVMSDGFLTSVSSL